jgi:hypothetical protein
VKTYMEQATRPIRRPKAKHAAWSWRVRERHAEIGPEELYRDILTLDSVHAPCQRARTRALRPLSVNCRSGSPRRCAPAPTDVLAVALSMHSIACGPLLPRPFTCFLAGAAVYPYLEQPLCNLLGKTNIFDRLSCVRHRAPSRPDGGRRPRRSSLERDAAPCQ